MSVDVRGQQTGMSALVVAAVIGFCLVPVALGALARSIRTFRLVLLLGLMPAIYYWIEVAVLDPSYDLARLDQLVFPAFYALAFVALWCLLAYVGRAAREALDRRQKSSGGACP
jgi:hypothetical protein